MICFDKEEYPTLHLDFNLVKKELIGYVRVIFPESRQRSNKINSTVGPSLWKGSGQEQEQISGLNGLLRMSNGESKG